MASQAFPIGGYSHSLGLEAAIDAGVVRDEAGVVRWIFDVLRFSLGSYEVPLLKSMGAAWRDRRLDAVRSLNEEFLATRESAELRRASVQMGYSLRALVHVLPGLPPVLAETLDGMTEPCLPSAWSGLAGAWDIGETESTLAYLWSWAENQVLVAMKTVPIGQSAGQRILVEVGPHLMEASLRSASSQLSNFAPGLAILSARHETQYSRLFRS